MAKWDLLPLRTDFDLSWRGYDSDQVQHYVHGAEKELQLLTADRDFALVHAESLAQQLEASARRTPSCVPGRPPSSTHQADAEQAADKLRRRAERLAAGLDRRRAEMEAEYRALMTACTTRFTRRPGRPNAAATNSRSRPPRSAVTSSRIEQAMALRTPRR